MCAIVATGRTTRRRTNGDEVWISEVPEGVTSPEMFGGERGLSDERERTETREKEKERGREKERKNEAASRRSL